MDGDMDLQSVEIEETECVKSKNIRIIRVPKQYIRDGGNPFEFYDDVEFKRRFRFSKESILYGILPKIEDSLTKINNRGLPISPAMQLLTCLRFYASGSFQTVLKDTIAVSQPTVSRIIFRVSALLASFIGEIIKMPTTQERKSENNQLFRTLGYGDGNIGLPGIDGVIDCIHIRLAHAKFDGDQDIFRNKKGYYSLCVQTVVGPRMEFLDIVPEYPGSRHDSEIFQESRLYMRYSKEQLNGILIGDSAYPVLPFLLTPVEDPQTRSEEMYNVIHERTRQIVETAYDIWRRRFPCLCRGLGTKLACTTTIVVACAVLHNLALMFREDLPEDDENDIIEYEEVPVSPSQEDHSLSEEGLIIRKTLIDSLF